MEEKATRLFEAIPCEAVPAGAAAHYARTKREAGTPLDENDLWIAATAMDCGARLVASVSDFRRIKGLAVEDWSA